MVKVDPVVVVEYRHGWELHPGDEFLLEFCDLKKNTKYWTIEKTDVIEIYSKNRLILERYEKINNS